MVPIPRKSSLKTTDQSLILYNLDSRRNSLYLVKTATALGPFSVSHHTSWKGALSSLHPGEALL